MEGGFLEEVGDYSHGLRQNLVLPFNQKHSSYVHTHITGPLQAGGPIGELCYDARDLEISARRVWGFRNDDNCNCS